MTVVTPLNRGSCDAALTDKVTRMGVFGLDQSRQLCPAPSRFGDLIIVLFIAMQVLDGALTYVGVQVFGRSVEANPLLFWLMQTVGDGAALAVAKSVALGLGAFLHLASLHRAIAVLVAVYLAAAVGPWTHLLFFY